MEMRTTGGTALKPFRNTIRNNKGFTLIELIIVIIIIGILAAVALPKYFELKKDAADAAAKGILGGLRGANSVLFASYLLRGTTTNYNLTDLVGAANLGGVQTALAGTALTVTVPGGGVYEFGYTPPVIPNTPAAVYCISQPTGGTTTACGDW